MQEAREFESRKYSYCRIIPPKYNNFDLAEIILEV